MTSLDGLLAGLLAAVAWGTADFCGRFAAQRVGDYRTALFAQLIGGLALVPWLWPAGGALAALETGLLILGAAGLNGLGVFVMYRAFRLGPLSITSPLVATYSGVAAILAITLSGERLQPSEAGALALILAGAILVAAAPGVRQGPGRPGVPWAILAALGFGVAFFLFSLIVRAIGPLPTAGLIRWATVACLLAAALPLRLSATLPPWSTWGLLLAVGLLDAAAYVAYSLGVAGEAVAVVAPVAGLFSAWTVFLARLVLHERLAGRQQIGIVVLLVGLVVLAAARST